VSEGIDKVMSRVGDITKQAAGVGDGKAPRGRAFPARQEVPRAKPAIALPAQEIKVRKITPVRQQTKATRFAATLKPMDVDAPAPPVTSGVVPALPAVASVPAAPPPDLRIVQSGAVRGDVVGQMGTPLSKLTMADDRGLVEVYRWRQGTVRMVNGVVSEVIPALTSGALGGCEEPRVRAPVAVSLGSAGISAVDGISA
jgi:hypothetical protein